MLLLTFPITTVGESIYCGMITGNEIPNLVALYSLLKQTIPTPSCFIASGMVHFVLSLALYFASVFIWLGCPKLPFLPLWGLEPVLQQLMEV